MALSHGLGADLPQTRDTEQWAEHSRQQTALGNKKLEPRLISASILLQIITIDSFIS